MTNQRDPLGDGISAVTLIDFMGDDIRVANAARVSMAKETDWDYEVLGDGEWDTKLSERDTKLISYLAKHQHWTPFSHVMITTRIKMPIFVARQWFKHQVGFTRNEVSRRYVDDAPEFFMPRTLRLRADNVKQGSSDETIPRDEPKIEVFCVQDGDQAFLTKDIGPYGNAISMYVSAGDLICMMGMLYEDMVDDYNVAPEMARMFLPQSMYTEFYETASLAAYARLVHQRVDSHAQREIQQYARAVLDLVRDIAPASWAALTGESK